MASKRLKGYGVLFPLPILSEKVKVNKRKAELFQIISDRLTKITISSNLEDVCFDLLFLYTFCCRKDKEKESDLEGEGEDREERIF